MHQPGHRPENTRQFGNSLGSVRAGETTGYRPGRRHVRQAPQFGHYIKAAMKDFNPNQLEKPDKPSFFKDFSMGCGTLVLLGFLIFVIVPLVVIGFQIAMWIAVPVATVILFVFAVALLGRIVSKGGKYR